MQKLTFFIKTNLIILKKSFKWGTVGFFSVSESKVIEKSKKKVKQEVVQFLPTKIVQKKSTCVWRSVYQKLQALKLFVENPVSKITKIRCLGQKI